VQWHRGWTASEHLLATLVELVSALRRDQQALGGVKKHSLPDLVRLDRPGTAKQEAPLMSAAAAGRLMQQTLGG
jgi:hypothetical protein